jgi:glucokinase
METVLAVDLGGTHTRVAVIGPQAVIADVMDTPTRHDYAHPDELFANIGKMRSQHEVARAVIGLPGRINYREGRLEYAPNLPPTWAAHLTVERLRRLTGVPTMLANDADVAAAGEAYFGAGRDHRDIVFMTVSTGIGAAVILDGRLVAGYRSGVEIGHVVIDREAARAGRPATVEQLGAGPALARAAAAAGVPERDAALVARAESGDPELADVWQQVTEAVGLGAVALAHMFCPEVIVIGGGFGEASHGLRAAAEAAVAERGPRDLPRRIVVVRASLGRDAGLRGAAAWQRAAGWQQAAGWQAVG